MNVRSLQQFLDSLVEPLRAGNAAQGVVADLQKITQALESFADRPLGEFAQFLGRASEYERQGHWPTSRPPIAGAVVDTPSPAQYAERLRNLLQNGVASGCMEESIPRELEALRAAVKLPQLKEIARACGVSGSISNAAQAVEKIFEHFTGKKLEAAILEMWQNRLLDVKDNVDQLDKYLADLQSAFTKTRMAKLAKLLGIRTKITSAADGVARIREHLLNLPTAVPATAQDKSAKDAVSDERVNLIVETLRALKAKAEPEDAPHDEIEEELSRLAADMNKEEAIAAAKRIGVIGTPTSKADALREIREEVFERKLIREKIRY